MARNRTRWQQHQYKLNALLLLFPLWFLYQGMTPDPLPPAWSAQQLGPFTIVPRPLDLDPPYSHHGLYQKDYSITFSQGDIRTIRQAYANLGPSPLPLAQLEQGAEGIMHGNRYSQHVHAIAPAQVQPGDQWWLTIQTWQGEVLISHWPIPD